MDFIKQPHARVTSSPSSTMEHSVASLVIQHPSRASRSHPRASRGRASSQPGDSNADRSYVCSYCGRTCRNAQALGGHMNVHRRERALANQLVQLRNQPGHCNQGGAHGMSNPLGGCVRGESEQDVIFHACAMQGRSSSSSSSPPCSQSSASRPVTPWKSVHLLPPCEPKSLCACDSLDLELRLGLAPE